MIRAFGIGEVWMPDASEGTEVYQEFLDALEAKKCAVKKAVAGDKIVSGDAGYEIKAAHHGSKTGITTELARALRPAVVVLSYGEGNDYGHPDQATLDVFASVGAQIYGTAVNGNVTVTSDGKSVTAQTSKDGTVAAGVSAEERRRQEADEIPV